MNMAELGIEIRKARKEKGFTLNKVAEDLGMSVNTLSRLENCHFDSDLGIMRVMRLMEHVGLTLETRKAGIEFAYTLDDAVEYNRTCPILNM